MDLFLLKPCAQKKIKTTYVTFVLLSKLHSSLPFSLYSSKKMYRKSETESIIIKTYKLLWNILLWNRNSTILQILQYFLWIQYYIHIICFFHCGIIIRIFLLAVKFQSKFLGKRSESPGSFSSFWSIQLLFLMNWILK